LICDTFLGSGTTRVAAHKEQRRFIGCEINKEFYDLQEQRWKNYKAQLTLF
jgi:site-specific DNA-methyltransferase (adenine-specific)